MKKLIQPIRFIVRMFFMIGLFIPALISSDAIGHKIWISIFFVGVFFCGWICPFGAIQDWLAFCACKMKIHRFRIPQKYNQYLQISRYFMYGLSTINVTLYLSSSNFYFNTVMKTGMWDWFNGIVLLAFMVLTIFIDRPFCQYFCIRGAYYGLMSAMRIFGITRNKHKCINCKLCNRNCPMNIDVANTEFVRHPNCINCMKCVNACPRDCIKFKLMALKMDKSQQTGRKQPN